MQKKVPLAVVGFIVIGGAGYYLLGPAPEVAPCPVDQVYDEAISACVSLPADPTVPPIEPTREPSAEPTREPSAEPTREPSPPSSDCNPRCLGREVCVAGDCEPPVRECDSRCGARESCVGGKCVPAYEPRPTPTPSATATPSEPPRPTPTPSGPPTPPPTPGPPGSKIGYGAGVTGGAGGKVLTLGPTSTEATLRGYLNQAGKRIITCLAGMAPPVYQLTQAVILQGPTGGNFGSDLTFDGEPCGGITVIKKPTNNANGEVNGVSFRNGVYNVWIRYVRFLGEWTPGSPPPPTPLWNNTATLEFDGDGAYPSWCIDGVYLEHVVTGFGMDSSPDLYGCIRNITYEAVFAYDNVRPTVDSDSNGLKERWNHSFIRNLYVNNGERSFKFKSDVRDIDLANNAIINWAAWYFAPNDPGGYGTLFEDDAAAGKNPRNVVGRGNAWISGPLSVVKDEAGKIVVDHRAWDCVYGGKAFCDAGGAPADPHLCNPRLSVGALRWTDNLFDVTHNSYGPYDCFTTTNGKALPDPPYPLTVLSSMDLESVILSAGIPLHDTPREAQLRAEALAAYKARKAKSPGPTK